MNDERIMKKLDEMHDSIHNIDKRVVALETKMKLMIPIISAVFVFVWNKAKSFIGVA